MESLSVQVLRRLPVGGADGTHGAARIGATFPVRALSLLSHIGGGTVPLPSGSTSASLRAAFPAPPCRPRALSISSRKAGPLFMTPTVQSLPHPRRVFRGEFALCIIAVLNSFAVYLMLYSGARPFPPSPQCRTSFRRCCRSSPSAHGLIFSKPRWWRC